MTQPIARKSRQGYELLCELVYRPLAHLLVLALQRTPVPPPAVVVCGMGIGLWGAWLLAQGRLLEAAVVFQIKTILDNADGQLARATGRVTLVGRYLDSEADLLVNAAICAAFGHLTGSIAVGVFSFAALTVILGLNFNLERLHGEAHGRRPAEARPARTRLEHILEHIYNAAYRPQDVLVERLVDWRIRRRGAAESAARAYHDRFVVGVLANLGLSSQLAILGILCAIGLPSLWTQVLGAQLGIVILCLVWREIRYAATMRAAPSMPDTITQGAVR